MTKPTANGDVALPKRNPPTLLPPTWMERGVRIEYTDAGGRGVETTAKLLGVCPAGLILAVDGARMCLSWDKWTMLELVER